jgi:hypothetical protein
MMYMKITVSIKERLHLNLLIPQEGSFLEMMAMRSLRAKVDFSEEEIKQHAIQEHGGSVQWEGESQKDIELTEADVSTLLDRVKELDAQKKIPLDFIGIIQKIKS